MVRLRVCSTQRARFGVHATELLAEAIPAHSISHSMKLFFFL